MKSFVCGEGLAGSLAGRVRLTEPGDEQPGHAAGVVARVAVGAGAQVADGQEAVEEVGVQGLEAGVVVRDHDGPAAQARQTKSICPSQRLVITCSIA